MQKKDWHFKKVAKRDIVGYIPCFSYIVWLQKTWNIEYELYETCFVCLFLLFWPLSLYMFSKTWGKEIIFILPFIPLYELSSMEQLSWTLDLYCFSPL